MVKMPHEPKKRLSPAEVEKLIDTGMPDKENSKEEKLKKWMMLSVRIPVDLVEEIDALVEENIGITRTGWILQAIQKEVKHVRQKEKNNET